MLKQHHQAWLSAHPERSFEWLKERLKEGFDVHHMDGNHSNNDPENLVLIDHIDHMRLHGSARADRLRRLSNVGRAQKTRRLKTAAQEAARRQFDRESYDKAARTGLTWREIGCALGFQSGANAMNAAKRHATAHQLPWPLRLKAA